MTAAAAVLAAALVFAVAGSAGAAAKGWPMKQEGEFLVIETPHYVVRTDMGAEVGQLIASHQEVLFAELYRRMAGTRTGLVAMQRAGILVVGSKAKYLALEGPDAKGLQGQYSPAKNQISGWGSKDELDDLLETFRHEGTHQFVAQFIGPKCPVWLNEGLAEYFKNAQFSGGELTVGQAPLFIVNDLKRALAANRLLPVQQMLSMSADTWNKTTHNQTPDAYSQYQEAWVMVHFLQHGDGGKYRGPFLQYIYYLARERDAGDAWQKAFGGDVAGLEKRLCEYLRNLKPAGGLGCRVNMSLLGLILLNLHAARQDPPDIATLRQWMIDGQLPSWTFTTASGLKISTADPEVLKSIFRCSEDKSAGDDPSYELAVGRPGEALIVRCRHHIGFVLETVCEKDENGKMAPKVVARPPASVPPPPKAAPAAKTQPAPTGDTKP
jgi:hypothetical protein